MTDHLKPCASCSQPCSHLGSRGRNVVCKSCTSRAVDSVGRPIEFAEDFVNAEGMTVFNGPAAFYRAPDPDAGLLNEEASASLVCWVDGIECQLFEGAAGWLGLVSEGRPKVEKAPIIIEF